MRCGIARCFGGAPCWAPRCHTTQRANPQRHVPSPPLPHHLTCARQDDARTAAAVERQRSDEALQRLQARHEALAAQVAQGERGLGAGGRQQVVEAVREHVADQVGRGKKEKGSTSAFDAWRSGGGGNCSWKLRLGFSLNTCSCLHCRVVTDS